MHVIYHDAVIPVIFALLLNKTESTYRRLIEKLCPSWNPKYLMMDFEQTATKGFADKFPTNANSSLMSGCFFPFAKQHSA